jgi:hypothetical protein
MNINEDYMIEEFWLDLKKSILNFYHDFKILSRPVDIWSNKLNDLQKKKEYILIESNIRDYMSLYAIDLLRNNSCYHIHILITNIKRWNTIAKNNSKFDIQSDCKYINIVFLLIDLYNIINVKTNNHSIIENDLISLFSTVELYIIHEDFKQFIDYAISHNKPSIIDKINEFENQSNNVNSIKYIESKYNIKLSPKICARKIFKILKLE